MSRVVTYEYVRLIERNEDENLLIVIASVREVLSDPSIQQHKVMSRMSHSEEYPLYDVPRHIELLQPIKPTQLNRQALSFLVKQYKNDKKSFLYYII